MASAADSKKAVLLGSQYRIVCSRHGENGYLDANGDKTKIYCSKYKNNRHTMWFINDAGGNSVYISNQKMSTYLGASYDRNNFPFLPNSIWIQQQKRAHNMCKWTLHQQNDGSFEIRADFTTTSGGSLLDGSAAGKHVYLSSYKNKHTKWFLKPIDEWKFQCSLTNFEFGSVRDAYQRNRTPIVFQETINAQVLGLTETVTIGEKFFNSFEFGFSENISIGVEIGVEAEIPLVGGSHMTATSEVKVGAHQTTVKSSELNYVKTSTFTPPEIGRYVRYLIIWSSRDTKVPFTCKYQVEGRTESGNKLPPHVIDAYVRGKGFKEGTAIKKQNGCVVYKISGDMYATLFLDTIPGVVPASDYADVLKEELGESGVAKRYIVEEQTEKRTVYRQNPRFAYQQSLERHLRSGSKM